MTETAIFGSPIDLSADDCQAARDASRALARLANNRSVHVEARSDPRSVPSKNQSFVLPAAAVRLLMDMLTHLAEGHSVAVIHDEAELTTQQAADMLNVSRPYLIGMIEKQELPYRLVGKHRRIRFRDLTTIRDAMQAKRRSALDELVGQAQELGLGY